TVCQPRRPGCVACPLAELCEAHRTNRADMLPVVSPRRAPVAVTHHVIAMERRGRYLFQQRPRTGLWANLWQLPTAEDVPPKQLPAWIDRACGLTVGELAHVHSFVHQTTHRTVSFQLWRAQTCRGRIKPGAGLWRRLDDLADLPLGNPQKKAI